MSVTTPNFTLEIKQGADLGYTFEFADDGGAITRGLTDARLQIRAYTTDETTIADWSVESGHFTIDEPAGKLTLTVPGADTDAISSGGVFDLKTYRGAAIDRHVQGKALVSPAVTRD